MKQFILACPQNKRRPIVGSYSTYELAFKAEVNYMNAYRGDKCEIIEVQVDDEEWLVEV
jgi:hypothetical protein